MHATQTLPENYRKLCDIDLEKNKKQYYLVNGLSLALMLIVLLPVWLLAPEGTELEHMRTVLFLPGMLVYIILHEAVHGVCFWYFSRQKPRFGWKSAYAYAASDCYYRKGPYLVIALAPVVLWGVVLAVLAALLPAEWYWTVQIIQMINLSGAAGDLYVTWLFLRMPSDVWVIDAGVNMRVYAPAEDEQETKTEASVN